MENSRKYGDEKLGYSVLASDMTPKEARSYWETNMNDGLTMHVDYRRNAAIFKRMREEQ